MSSQEFSTNSKSIAEKCYSLFDEPIHEEEGVLYSEIKQVMHQQRRYTDLTEIGVGGMKRIYKAFDQSTAKHVAYAQLRDDVDHFPSGIQEVFLREARLTARLDHPNIIAIHDIGLKEDAAPYFTPYFTMDLKRGDTLAAILKEISSGNQTYTEQYPLEVRLEIFSKVCDAVSHAHAKYILHLDIKPDNIQVGEHGDVLLCDWGLGKIIITEGDKRSEPDEIQDETIELLLEDMLVEQQVLNHMTSFNAIKGTPGYMPPEQIEGKSKDERNDIYALGCLLFSICALKPPFDGNAAEILEKTKAGNMEAFPVDQPKSLGAIIHKATALNPSDRYQHVRELKHDIFLYQTGHAPGAERISPLKGLSLFLKRHQQAATISLLALLILTITSLVFLLEINHERERLLQATHELEATNKEAVSAKEQAQRNLKRAEYVSQQYRNEKEISQNLMADLEKSLMRNFYRLGKNFHAQPVAATNTAINSLKQILTEKPDNEHIQRQLVQLEFTKQFFPGVIEMADRGYPIDAWDEKWARTYLPFRNGRTIRLDKFAELIHKLAKNPALDVRVERMLAIDQELRERKYNPIELIIPVFKAWNPDWNPAETPEEKNDISYDQDSLTFRINSPDIKILSSLGLRRKISRSPLRHLKIHHLDLSHSGIYDLNHIADLDIHVLTIAHTHIDNLEPLRTSTVRELIIHPAQFHADQLEVLLERISLIEK